MAATYDLSSGFTDLTRVRFHIGDTDVAENAMLQDEEINAVITEAGGWQEAVIACLRHLRAQVARPDFTADWLTVTNSTARASFDKLISDKLAEFGLNNLEMSAGHVTRWDHGSDE